MHAELTKLRSPSPYGRRRQENLPCEGWQLSTHPRKPWVCFPLPGGMCMSNISLFAHVFSQKMGEGTRAYDVRPQLPP